MLYFMTAIVLITGNTAREYVQKVFTQRGATIRLNCTGRSTSGAWRGPDQKNNVENNRLPSNIPYFNGYEKNPKINVTNVKLENDSTSGKYDLVVTNITVQNLGIYQCQLSRSTDNKPLVRIYQVLFKRTSERDLDTQDTSRKGEMSNIESTSWQNGITVSKTIQQQKTSSALPIVATGLLVVSATVAVLLTRKYCSRQLHTKWNAAVSYCVSTHTRNNESGEDEDTVESEAVQNHLYQSTELDVHQRHQRIQLANSTENHRSPVVQENQEYFNINPPNGQHAYRNRTTEGVFQISDRGLNYSEVFHVPGVFREIRGIADRTIYIEIDHSLTALPLPDNTDSDSSSHENL